MSQIPNIELKVSEREQEFLFGVKREIDRGIDAMNRGEHDRAILIFKQLVPKVDAASSVYDVLQYDLLTAYKQRIEQLLLQDDVTPVNRYLPEVFRLELRGVLSPDFEFKAGFADNFRQLGLAFYAKRQHEAALACFRRAIAVQPDPSYYVDLTNAIAFTKERARLADYTQAYKKSDLGRHIFIACAPKSGSTFLKNVLVGVTGFRDLFTVYAALQNEQDIDMPLLAKFGTVNTVTQQHARASEANIQLMQAFEIRPVILVRNIFDTAVSLLDFYRKGFTFSTFFDRQEFLTFTEDQQIDLLIEYAIPWYFQFVASWHRAERDGRLEMCWLTFEDMISDKSAAVQNILSFYGLSASGPIIEEQIDRSETNSEMSRFNKGVTGRGGMLSSPQRERIVSLARHFPSVDFTCFGL